MRYMVVCCLRMRLHRLRILERFFHRGVFLCAPGFAQHVDAPLLRFIILSIHYLPACQPIYCIWIQLMVLRCWIQKTFVHVHELSGGGRVVLESLVDIVLHGRGVATTVCRCAVEFADPSLFAHCCVGEDRGTFRGGHRRPGELLCVSLQRWMSRLGTHSRTRPHCGVRTSRGERRRLHVGSGRRRRRRRVLAGLDAGVAEVFVSALPSCALQARGQFRAPSCSHTRG